MKNKPWNKCCICGKFIAYDDFTNGKTITEYTPDSEFTEETIIHSHVKCVYKQHKIGERK